MARWPRPRLLRLDNINTVGGNLIVNVKEARIALAKEMAQKIMV